MNPNKNISLAIGAFIMGALLLVFVALLFFSGGKLFAQKERVVMHFDGSVQGLQIGAPVKLKGVVLGEISDIQITFQSDAATAAHRQPVVTTVTASLILKRINTSGASADDAFLKTSIANGLRAQLNYQSFLTGLLYVELDFHPDAPLRLYKLQDSIIELPTMATDFEQFSKKFQNINLEDLVSNINRLAVQVNTLVASGRIEATFDNADRTLNAFEQTAVNLDQQSQQLGDELRATIAQANTLISELNTQTPKLAGRLQSSIEQLNISLEKFDVAASQIASTFSEDAPIVVRLDDTLQDISRSARALRNLSDSLDQQPDAIWRGRSAQESD